MEECTDGRLLLLKRVQRVESTLLSDNSSIHLFEHGQLSSQHVSRCGAISEPAGFVSHTFEQMWQLMGV